MRKAESRIIAQIRSKKFLNTLPNISKYPALYVSCFFKIANHAPKIFFQQAVYINYPFSLLPPPPHWRSWEEIALPGREHKRFVPKFAWSWSPPPPLSDDRERAIRAWKTNPQPSRSCVAINSWREDTTRPSFPKIPRHGFKNSSNLFNVIVGPGQLSAPLMSTD